MPIRGGESNTVRQHAILKIKKVTYLNLTNRLGRASGPIAYEIPSDLRVEFEIEQCLTLS